MISFARGVTDKIGRRIAVQIQQLANHNDSRDVIDMAFFRAGLEAGEFYERHLLHATPFRTTRDMLHDAVAHAPADGLVLEFGVATGTTVGNIAEKYAGPIYGFDSFEGLPEDWYSTYTKGQFARTELPPVPENVSLIKGWFTDTLPQFLEQHPGPVSLLHIDCDLYSSTSFVLQTLAVRIRPGCVIVFDEYFNYPGWRAHEYKAFEEFIASTGLKFRYHSLLRTHQAVSVIIE